MMILTERAPRGAPAFLCSVLAAFFATFLTAATLLLTQPALAQSQGTDVIDYNRWTAVAETAEALIENPNATEEALSNIRATVSDQRAQFLAARTELQTRLDAIQQQIDALGPLPEEGTTEAPEIVQRRAELAETLSERQTPLLAAEVAFARADSIVREIDRELRARQADALLTLAPSPANPSNWLEGVTALLGAVQRLNDEVMGAWKDPAHRTERLTDLPISLGALFLALLFLLRGRRWMEELTGYLLSSTAILRGRVVAAFFVSLSQLLVPFLGLWLLSNAIVLSRFTGPTIDSMIQVLLPSGMALFVARWLSLHIFPIVEDSQTSLNLDEDSRRKARRATLFLGVFAMIDGLGRAFVGFDALPPAAQVTLEFPVLVLGAFGLFRFARLLSRHQPRRVATETDETAPKNPFFDRIIAIMAKLVMLAAILSPLLGLAGYMAAARQIVFPTIDSLALIGLLMVLHRLVTAIYAAITGDEREAAEGLVPALAGLFLSILAVGPLALIWGARTTDLLEVYTRFSEGFSLGNTRLSPAAIVWFLVVFAAGYTITRALQGALGTSVLPKTSMEKGAQKALVSGVGYVGITIAALVAFSSAGIDLSGLAIVAGALSVGIGFGLQNIVSNFVSGIILLIERPVSEGDWVEVGSISGTIRRISVRSTMIETFDRSKVIVPNADLISGAVTNYTKSTKTGRVIVPVGVAYGTDTRKVAAILQEIAEEEPLVTLDPKPSVVFMGFGADSLNFEIRAILRDVTFKLSVASEMNHKIAQRFVEAGIEIPFAQRDIWLRNPEALTQLPPRTEPPAPPTPERSRERNVESATESPDQTDEPESRPQNP